jgi:hypothetical protein
MSQSTGDHHLEHDLNITHIDMSGIIIITTTIAAAAAIQYTKHSTNNTKHSKYKYTYYQTTHTLQNPHTHTHITKQVKTTTKKDIPKRNSHNIIKYPQYKVTLMYVVLFPQKLHHNALHFTSLHFRIKSLHINQVGSLHITTLFTPHHYTFHSTFHSTSLHTLQCRQMTVD